MELASTQQYGNTSPADADQSPNAGKLILDATVAEQAIRYPTDLSLLNEAREFSEQIIDILYPRTSWTKKPRMAFLAIAKQRRPDHKVIRSRPSAEKNIFSGFPLKESSAKGRTVTG